MRLSKRRISAALVAVGFSTLSICMVSCNRNSASGVTGQEKHPELIWDFTRHGSLWETISVKSTEVDIMEVCRDKIISIKFDDNRHAVINARRVFVSSSRSDGAT